MSPRSGASFMIEEVKDQCQNQNVELEEIFNLAKKPGTTYAAQSDLKASLRKCLPRLSRELIDKIIRGFNTEKIEQKNYFVYFGLKDDTIEEPEEAKEKSQKEWITMFTDLLNSSKLNPQVFAKEADVNKDGVIDLKEFEESVKKHIRNSKLSFLELQHIVRAFDINRDNKVTINEYNAIIKKYGSEIKTSNKDDIIEEARKVCRTNGFTLKDCLSEFTFDDKKEISVIMAQKKIRDDTGFDKKQANDLINAIKTGDQNYITGEEMFAFYDEYIPDYENVKLELKYILACAKYEQSTTIFKFITQDLDMDPNEDILIKDFTSKLGGRVFFGKSSCENLYREVKKQRPEIPNPNIVDFYTLVLNQRDIDQLPTELRNSKKVIEKLQEGLAERTGEALAPALIAVGKKSNKDFSAKSEDHIEIYEFIKIFVDINRLVTSREALLIYDEITNPDSKQKRQARGSTTGKDIYKIIVGEPAKAEPPNKEEPSKKMDLPKKEEAKKPIPKAEEEDDDGAEEEKIETKKPTAGKASAVQNIEKTSKIYLPIIYDRFKKSVLVKSDNLNSYITPFFTEKGVKPADIQAATDEIMGGAAEIKFKELSKSIETLSSYKFTTKDRMKELSGIIKEAAASNLLDDVSKDKGYINTILKLKRDPKDEYRKFELIRTFYKNMKEIKTLAGTAAAPPVETKQDVKKKAPQEEEKKNPVIGAFAMFGKDTKEEGPAGPMGPVGPAAARPDAGAMALLEQIKEKVEATDFGVLRQKDDTNNADASKSFHVDKDEQKKFNLLLSNFI